MELPKISVVTVSFNQGRFIRQNIESVLAQKYPNFEHIVIDAGSTDETLSILKSYPHLLWTSEPDRGQSDGLNKGFSRAQGEIIAWLNSDDWYAPNIFYEVAEGLKKSVVILAPAIETDIDGNQKQIVSNTARNFFDLLKYWVPYAWLAQTSVFFRKSLLDSVKREDGTYFDESLYYCMDYDLWMRMGLKSDFPKVSLKPFSYFRIYEENKTGKHPLAAQRECARVYRRYSNSIGHSERKFSYVIALNEIQPTVADTVASIAGQSLEDGEVLFVDYSGSKETAKNLREFCFSLSERFNHLTVRSETAEAPKLFAAYNRAIKTSAASALVFLQPGDMLASDFALIGSNILSRDVTGLALPYKDRPDLQQLLYDPKNNNLLTEGVFNCSQFIYPNFLARKTLLLDIGGFKEWQCPEYAVREFLIHAYFKGWHVSIKSPLAISPLKRDYTRENLLTEVAGIYFNAQVILNRTHELENDPFAAVRVQSGISPQFLPQSIDSANTLLQKLPRDWHQSDFHNDEFALQKLIQADSNFAPSWFFLAKIFDRTGRGPEAAQAWNRYTKIREGLRL